MSETPYLIIFKVNAPRMTMFFCIVLLFMTCLKLGLFYYFNKLLGFVAVAFFSVFLGETLVASLRFFVQTVLGKLLLLQI